MSWIDRRPFAWLAWASGIVYLALFLADIVLTPGEPDPGTPARQVATFYTNYHTGILTTSLLHDLSGVFFLIFLAGLLVVLPGGRAVGPLPILAGLSAAVAGSVAYASYVSAGAAAYLAEHGGSVEIVAALALLRYLASAVAVLPLAVFLAAASLLVLQRRAVPRWVGWLGLVAAAANAVSIFGLYDPSSPLGLVGFLGAILFAVWMLAVNITLLARGLTGSSAESAELARA